MCPAMINVPSTPSKDVYMNGSNGTSSPSVTSSPPVKRYAFRSSSMNGNGNNGSTTYVVHSTVQALEKRGAAELGFGVFESISGTTFIDLVEAIRSERLSSLPHKGGKWDKVLMKALYFAEKLHGFDKMVKSFSADDSTAACLGYGYCKLLLEVRVLSFLLYWMDVAN